MRIPLNPIMLACLATTLPVFTGSAQSAEVGQVVVNDPTGSTQRTLNNGDTATYAGAGAAIDVSVAGNTVRGDGITVTAGSAPASNTIGVRAGAGGAVTLTNSTVTTVGNGVGINVTGANSVVTLRNTMVSTGSGAGANVQGGRFEMDGGSITAGNTGVSLTATGTAFTATRFDIKSAHVGIDNRGGVVTLTDGTVTTQGNNAHGLYVSREFGTSASVTATRVDITTQGDGSVGVLARVGGAAVTLEDANITTHGANALGLFASGTGVILSTRNTVVNTSGANATGLSMTNRSVITLDNTRFTLQGAGANGIQSGLTVAGLSNSITLRNGSQISTQDGVGLLTLGGNHTFLVSDSSITARAGGNVDNGVLLQSSRSVSGLESEQVTLDASNSVLTGDVLAGSGTVDVALKSGSVLTGSLVQRGPGRINSLALDNASTWNVRNDSSLGTLNNAGTVAFAAPAGGTGFKTLTVNNYIGGGTLVLNTHLGDDASPTDKLVIDGGTASGNTGLRIINAGSEGGQTQYGIRVVQTINGGTTATDAFHLDPGSTGYRASADTLSLNGYDYSLIRGGVGGVAPDWYLASDYNPPSSGVSPGGSDFQNVSPESGAYAGNRLAATRLFTHGLHDRTSAYVDDGTATGRGLWVRVLGRNDSGLRMSEGHVDIDTDSSLVQLGGDVFKAPVGSAGAVYAGLMGGYGDARTTSTSTLTLPGGNSVQARARGKVSGYSVGLYGTVYQNDATRLGAYADTWLQYGRYDNQISSELGSVNYRSNVWSASLETGYAFKPFAADSALAAIVIEPNAQLVYSRYNAKDATLQGTRMRSGNDNAWQSRVGVRVYPQAKPQADTPSVRPFLEANWLYNGSNPSVRMGDNALDALPSRNALELKLGAQGRVTKSVQVSGHVFGQTGSHDQRGYGGMLSASYRW